MVVADGLGVVAEERAVAPVLEVGQVDDVALVVVAAAEVLVVVAAGTVAAADVEVADVVAADVVAADTGAGRVVDSVVVLAIYIKYKILTG